MIKAKIETIHQKNRIINNIINAMVNRNHFLLCGHKDPDEDCIASMIAFAILLIKFDKIVRIYINGHVPDNINYLIDICKYNSIKLINKNSRLVAGIDTIVICDTPKPEMLDINKKIKKLFNQEDIIKIENEHHIASDGEYIGDEGYLLVTDASSTSELVGLIALKLKNKKKLLKQFLISDPISRNLVLTILTGIVSDTNMGQFLKSKGEKKFYDIFAALYNEILMRTTVKETNFTRIEEVFNELQHLSEQGKKCYEYIIKKHKIFNSVGYVILNEDDMNYLYNTFDEDIIITISKHVANELAEKSKKVSLLSYYDNPLKSNLIQIRMRRCHNYKKFDLRRVLEIFSIADGGGHEGAIGFRFPKESIENKEEYLLNIIKGVAKEIK